MEGLGNFSFDMFRDSTSDRGESYSGGAADIFGSRGLVQDGNLNTPVAMTTDNSFNFVKSNDLEISFEALPITGSLSINLLMVIIILWYLFLPPPPPHTFKYILKHQLTIRIMIFKFRSTSIVSYLG